MHVGPNLFQPTPSIRPVSTDSFWSPLVIGCIAGGSAVVVIALLAVLVILRSRSQGRIIVGKVTPIAAAPTPETTLPTMTSPIHAAPVMRGDVFAPASSPSAAVVAPLAKPRKGKIAMNPILSMSSDTNERALGLSSALHASVVQSSLYRGRGSRLAVSRRAQSRREPPDDNAVRVKVDAVEPVVNPLLAFRDQMTHGAPHVAGTKTEGTHAAPAATSESKAGVAPAKIMRRPLGRF